MSAPLKWDGRPVLGLIFDMDGVLTDSRAAHLESWTRFLEKENLPHDPEEFFHRIFGQGKDDNIPLAYGRDDLSQEFIDAKADEIEAGFLVAFREGRVPSIPGALDFIAAMKARGLRLCLGTSAPRENLETVLDGYELRDKFDASVAVEEVTRAKPAPEIFLRCCEKIKLPPEDCVVFEDSLHGLRAAHAAGSRAIGIATTHPRDKLLPHAELVVKDFVELMKIEPWKVTPR